MTIQELIDFAAANDLGSDTEITFTDFSGHGSLDINALHVVGADDSVRGYSRMLDIDVT